jgi:hypothetical protein
MRAESQSLKLLKNTILADSATYAFKLVVFIPPLLPRSSDAAPVQE